ncbi:MAG: hypothetical protein AMXMBFR36_11460 [Acidobacteriota bacterium]
MKRVLRTARPFAAALLVAVASGSARPAAAAALSADDAVRRALAASPVIARAEQEVALRSGAVTQAEGLFDNALLSDFRVDYGVEELFGSRLKAEQDRRLRLEIPPPILDDIAAKLIDRLPTDASFFLPSSCLQATSFIVLGDTSTVVCVNDDGNVLGILDPSIALDPSLFTTLELGEAFAGLSGFDERLQVFIDLIRNSAADQMRLTALILRRTADSLRFQRIRIGQVPEDRVSIRMDAGVDYRIPMRSGAALISSLSLGSSEENFRGKRLDPTWGDALIANQFRMTAGLALDLPLGRGAGRVSFEAPLVAARRGQVAAEALYEHTASERALATLEAYWDVAAAARRLDLLEQSLVIQDRLLGASGELAEAGVIPRVDLELNRARRASTESSVAGARQALTVARAELARVLGIEAAELETIETDADLAGWIGADPLGTGDVEALVSRAVAERDDLRAAGERLAADRALAAAAEHDLRPQVALQINASYNAFHETFRERFYDPEGFEKAMDEPWSGPSYGAALRIRLPIGNNAARGRLLQARSAATSSEIGSIDLRRSIRLSVIEAAEALRRSRAELESRREALARIEETAEATVERFRAGDLTVLDTLITESDLTNARLEVLAAERTYLSLAARLRFATGTLLDLPAAGDVRGARLAPFAQPIL